MEDFCYKWQYVFWGAQEFGCIYCGSLDSQWLRHIPWLPVRLRDWGHRLEVVGRSRPSTFICLTSDRKHGNLNQGCLKMTGTFRSVQLATFERSVSRGLLISGTLLIRPQTSFVSRRSSCRKRGFHAATNFASTISIGEKWNLPILLNLLVINVPICISCSAETLELIIPTAASWRGCRQLIFRYGTQSPSFPAQNLLTPLCVQRILDVFQRAVPTGSLNMIINL